ncbi:hypothetical protein EIN_247120 [Entamoeba invadens IP1]|uniref:Uncharacterized protein n=1 Tax=Entamoeba invadens IP1 TaxID=370355 RepID=A0A0A1UEA5_ENTIV|nr:hypothetical protein EIN_247120 [Entamoeba invadens IP1]ELP94818.1 hypothetical protein EIN_247120 [Entamoeba invadens IP1]|eukprot:XP_004261589.1 hypothetical protein EIN_247120 [Entamoeba invadens IP1]
MFSKVRVISDWLQSVDLEFLVALQRIFDLIKHLFETRSFIDTEEFEQLPFIRKVNNSDQMKNLKEVCLSITENFLKSLIFRFSDSLNKVTTVMPNDNDSTQTKVSQSDFKLTHFGHFEQLYERNDFVLKTDILLNLIPNNIERPRYYRYNSEQEKKVKEFEHIIKLKPEFESVRDKQKNGTLSQIQLPKIRMFKDIKSNVENFHSTSHYEVNSMEEETDNASTMSDVDQI